MLSETRTSLHYGINFVVAPAPMLEQQRFLRFQQELAIKNVEFQHSEQRKRQGFTLIAAEPQPLEVKILEVGPQVGQLLVLSPNPRVQLNAFIEYAEIICETFRLVWREAVQILTHDVTIRHLYQSEGDHAFKYLWEKRLGQHEKGLSSLGRPVLGGGLRLVMPPPEGETDGTQVEVKIESFLRDSKMLFIETQFVWPRPVSIDVGFKPRVLLEQVERFATNEVVNFVLRGEK